MALGSLLDAGADVDAVRSILGAIDLPGWRLETERVARAGIASTRVHVHVDEPDPPSRPARVIATMIGDAPLPPRVKRRSLDAFALLSQVEGALHGQSPAEVHFHEVGGHDAVIDVVGTMAALELLDVAHVYCSAIALGTGVIDAAHGAIPNPGPAVLRLLEGAATMGVATPRELTTPTGAAIVASLARSFGEMPAIRIHSSGYGAGRWDDPARANCTQVVIGSLTDGADGEDEVVLLETNVDDATGEALGVALDRLLKAGALDAWIAPILAKKGRPAHLVSVLSTPALHGALASELMASLGTLGVRVQRTTRMVASRSMVTVVVDGEEVRVKLGPHRTKAEADDVARVMAISARSFEDVAGEAEHLARRLRS